MALNRHVPQKGQIMTIRVGTLVKRHSPSNGDNPCEVYTDWSRYTEMDIDGILDICLGVVIDTGMHETDITVRWMQMCPYHKKLDWYAQERLHVDEMYEVGQLR